MKARILGLVLIGIALLALFVNGVQAQDRNQPLLTVNNVFSALSSGEVDTAMTAFAENATAENRVRGESYRGLEEIRQMLQDMGNNGRQYTVVGYQQTGDTIIAQVEVSDRGLAWGTETILAEVKDGKVQAFNVAAFRLELWKLGR
jgi:Fe2+ transport system protein FeoA